MEIAGTPKKRAVEKLTSKGRWLDDRSNALFQDLRKTLLEDNDFDEAKSIFDRLGDFSQMRLLLSDLSREFEAQGDGTPTFAIGSEILYTVYRQLCEIPTESIIFAVGSRYGNAYTVERLAPLKMEKSEVGYACADLQSSTKTLIDLEPYGTLLTCYFHAHPGRGGSANNPSGIDINNHKRLEQGNYHTVGGIFSRDGYVRFFTDQMPFEIRLSGKGIDHVAKNLWKLTEA